MTRSSFLKRRTRQGCGISISRRGMTLIELLVSTAILSTLMALIVPGVMNARSAARTTECLNHLRQLGIAEINYESSRGSVPPLEDGTAPGNWVFYLLPHLDQAAVYRELADLRSASRAGGPAVSGPGLAAISIPGEPAGFPEVPHLSVLTCPVDEGHFGIDAGLSYVANAGYMRHGYWGAASDTNHTLEAYTESSPSWSQTVTQATGVFFRSTLGRHRLKPQFADGRSQTILFSENLQAGDFTSPYTGDIGFGVPGAYAEMPGPPVAGPGILELGVSFFPFADATINANVNSAARGEAPRPSSHHSQGVNVVFADGSARFLNESINDFVYYRLVSSSGSTYGQRLVSDSSY